MLKEKKINLSISCQPRRNGFQKKETAKHDIVLTNTNHPSPTTSLEDFTVDADVEPWMVETTTVPVVIVGNPETTTVSALKVGKPSSSSALQKTEFTKFIARTPSREGDSLVSQTKM